MPFRLDAWASRRLKELASAQGLIVSTECDDSRVYLRPRGSVAWDDNSTKVSRTLAITVWMDYGGFVWLAPREPAKVYATAPETGPASYTLFRSANRTDEGAPRFVHPPGQGPIRQHGLFLFGFAFSKISSVAFCFPFSLGPLRASFADPPVAGVHEVGRFRFHKDVRQNFGLSKVFDIQDRRHLRLKFVQLPVSAGKSRVASQCFLSGAPA